MARTRFAGVENLFGDVVRGDETAEQVNGDGEAGLP